MFALFRVRIRRCGGTARQCAKTDRRGLASRRRWSWSSTRRFNYSLGVEYSEWWLTGYRTAAGNHTYSAVRVLIKLFRIALH